MLNSSPLPHYARVRYVRSIAELAQTRFADGVNALCWPRTLAGDFGKIAAHFRDATDPIVTLSDDQLRELRLTAAGRTAVDSLLADLHALRDLDREPVLNCIHGYPRDEEPGPVVTDVFSFHADSAPIEADTWLCTYHGSPSEGLRNEEAVRRIELPATRAALLRDYGGEDDEGFREFLQAHCYDLHYAPAENAAPYSFGHFNLWRIAVDYPDSPVPPCIHRAPATIPGQPRLLLIS